MNHVQTENDHSEQASFDRACLMSVLPVVSLFLAGPAAALLLIG